MYADFSRDQVNAFLQAIVDETSDIEGEDHMDAEMTMLMEQVRCRRAFATRKPFLSRSAMFGAPRAHPADCA